MKPRSGPIAVLTHDLAATRRELIQLRRENTQLRQRLGDTAARKGAKAARGHLRNRESEILAMVKEQQAIGSRALGNGPAASSQKQ